MDIKPQPPKMEPLSSSFLPKHPQLLHLPSFKINVINKIHQPMMITSNSSFFTTTFDPIKKLIIKHTPQTLDQILKKPHSPSKQLVDNINNKKPNLLAIIFNTLDDFICSFVDPPVRPSIDPKRVLLGNFAPVDELPPTVVEGGSPLPPCLDGVYIRNGPNPHFFPKSPYHFLDGDGMLHVIKICQGKATFCSRYVKTHKYLMEGKTGYPIVPNFIAGFNGVVPSMARLALTCARVLAKQFDPLRHGFGVANTSVALLCGRLFALCESDLPYEVKVTEDGDIITLGRHDFRSSEPFLRMTAHPKTDKVTGEAFGYGYDVVRPYLTFYRIDGGGRKQKGVPILSMEKCAAIHDFAVTENYVVFPDAQIVLNPWWILGGRSPVGIDPDKIPRLGIIPRYAEDERDMRWIDAPGFNMLHCVNAWEEDGGAAIVMVASNIVSAEHIFDDMESSQLTLEKITIDVKAKSMKRQSLSTQVLDFAVINPAYAAKKNRYVYAGVKGPKSWLGVVKLDLSLTDDDGGDCTVASRLYGPGWCGGEPFFVPKEPNNPTSDEDDGYLITYVHDENTEESKFLVMDAKSHTLDIIAAVKLPQRVPNGFHGLFVSQSDLDKL